MSTDGSWTQQRGQCRLLLKISTLLFPSVNSFWRIYGTEFVWKHLASSYYCPIRIAWQRCMWKHKNCTDHHQQSLLRGQNGNRTFTTEFSDTYHSSMQLETPTHRVKAIKLLQGLQLMESSTCLHLDTTKDEKRRNCYNVFGDAASLELRTTSVRCGDNGTWHITAIENGGVSWIHLDTK